MEDVGGRAAERMSDRLPFTHPGGSATLNTSAFSPVDILRSKRVLLQCPDTEAGKS